MPLPVCLRLQCTCSSPFVSDTISWSVESTVITFHAILWWECLVSCYTEPSSENECNFNEINSTQIVNNWKLKAVESVSAKMTRPSHVNECVCFSE